MLFVPGSSAPPEGPLDAATIQARAKAGALPEDARICVVGGEQWVLVSALIKKPSPSFEVKVGDAVAGPVTLDQIRRGVDAGKIPRDASARQIGEDRWLEIADVLAGDRPARAGGLDVLAPPSLDVSSKTVTAPTQPPSARIGRNDLLAVGAAAAVLLVAGVVAAIVHVRGGSEATASASSSALAPSATAAPTPPAPAGLMPLGQFVTGWNAKAAGLDPRLQIKDEAPSQVKFAPDLVLDIKAGGGAQVVSITMSKGASMNATVLGRAAFSVLVGVVAPGVDERGLIDELGMKTGTSTTAVRGPLTFAFSQKPGGPEIISARPTEAPAATAAPAASPPAPSVKCQRTPDIDDICDYDGKVGFNCWGGTVGDVKKAYPSCEYVQFSRFCCSAPQ